LTESTAATAVNAKRMGLIVGLVTERDLLRRAAALESDLLTTVEYRPAGRTSGSDRKAICRQSEDAR